MLAVFTDLDGALLDRHTYSFAEAAPALRQLKQRRAAVILVSSKTLREVEYWRDQVKTQSPFAVENGAAVFVGKEGPVLPRDARRQYGDYQIVEFGVPYSALTRALKDAAHESGCRICGFSDMKAEEISSISGLPLDQAALAKRRQYDEPFVILEGDPSQLRRAVEKRGYRLTRGGRFSHITGQNDKADAVRLLIDAYRRMGPVRTIGIGDGLNDTGFLNLVDYPVVLDSAAVDEVLKRVPRARVAAAGPPGWNESVLEIVGFSVMCR
jgi:mannosyl-3-phosphoglycerate phosphatase